jgi:hypothetical protein
MGAMALEVVVKCLETEDKRLVVARVEADQICKDDKRDLVLGAVIDVG